jgi:hypothetical protein
VGDLRVSVDPDHGGRWTSLISPSGREWLQHRDTPERLTARPGDAFVDAGGLEECIPTVGGVPDHGDAWARRWVPEGDGLTVHGDGYWLHRQIREGAEHIVVSYVLSARPGWRFLWAGHALLDLSSSARLKAPGGHPTYVNSPAGIELTGWPALGNTDLSLLGPSDGTAVMLYLPGLSRMTVLDGPERLTLSVQVVGQPYGMAVWRNLGGWPEGKPYRSVGVEPMLGHGGTLALAGSQEAAIVPEAGSVKWTMMLQCDAV